MIPTGRVTLLFGDIQGSATARARLNDGRATPSAARVRLGDREADLVRRGAELTYDEVCDLALGLIERYASRKEPAELLDSDPGPSAVGAVDPHH